MRRALFAFSFLLCAAAPLSDGLPARQQAVLRNYLDALAHQDYPRAYGALTRSEQQYFRNAANYASVFRVDGWTLQSYHIQKARGNERGRVVFVSERIHSMDVVHGRTVDAGVVVPYGLVPEGGATRIKDRFHPWKALAPTARANESGLRVEVLKVAFYAHYIEIVVRFVNTSDGFITVLPFGRTVLHDEAKQRYRLIESRDWSMTDKQLFLGLRLAGYAQYTGTLRFESPLNVAATQLFLTLAPALREGSNEPFAITLPPLAVSP